MLRAVGVVVVMRSRERERGGGGALSPNLVSLRSGLRKNYSFKVVIFKNKVWPGPNTSF